MQSNGVVAWLLGNGAMTFIYHIIIAYFVCNLK